MSLLSPYLDHFHQFIKQRNDSNTVKRVINRVTELLIINCLTGENYKKYRIEQNQRSYKEYCFACVNVESTFKLLLMRRFTDMIDPQQSLLFGEVCSTSQKDQRPPYFQSSTQGTNFKSFFIVWVFVV